MFIAKLLSILQGLLNEFDDPIPMRNNILFILESNHCAIDYYNHSVLHNLDATCR